MQGGSPSNAAEAGADPWDGPIEHPSKEDSATPQQQSRCGTRVLDVSGLIDVDALAIDKHGNLFTATLAAASYAVRMVDGTDRTCPLPLQVRDAVYGMTFDPTGTRLIIGTARNLHVLDVSSDVCGTEVHRTSVGYEINDLATGPDGALYASTQGKLGVLRLPGFPPEGSSRETVLQGSLDQFGSDPRAAGLAFGPDGALFVGLIRGNILRLEIAAGKAVSVSSYAAVNLHGNGLAFDEAGNLYVARFFGYETTAGITMVTPKGEIRAVAETEGVPRLSSLAFGTGALDCKRLYAAGQGHVRSVATEARGLAMPWQ